MRAIVERGRSFPLGATVEPAGVNFSVYSKDARSVQLLLFDGVEDAAPSRIIDLDAARHRTYHYWHAFVPGVGPGQIYAYRAAGGFDDGSVLLDPYGRCVARPRAYSREATSRPGGDPAGAWKSVVADMGAYDWEDDLPPRTPYTKTVVYEMHVGGFTRHPTSGVSPDRRGTYSGLVEKIPYLRDLGVTAVELLPVFAFDAQAAPRGRTNVWGYMPVSFFAPHEAYGAGRDPLGVLDEFRDMVKALHRARLEVLLDVVFNHTAEGGLDGPTLGFRGLSNDVYYIVREDGRAYADYTGCGNTLNANQPIVRRLILDSLRHWVREMHVDGFRFDLASVLARDEEGRPMANPPILWDIESDPVLADVKLIAEAWDAGGLYQVGGFVGDAWQEWNGRFRDDVRAFVKGDPGMTRAAAQRLIGSPDLYAHEEREPEQSVNFVTCHDGFTLNDLVSYNAKHNEANGEENRDGTDANLSWNCGVEGPTDDPAIERLRNRQVKNFMTLTLLAAGTPMLLMGDEVRRTQGGNNNGYCLDDESGWFDWSLVERHADVLRFTSRLIALRLDRDLSAERADMTLSEMLRRQPVRWHGVRLDAPDWSHESRSLAGTIVLADGRTCLHVIVNAYWEPLDFEIPPRAPAAGGWRRLVDTSLDAPDDVRDLGSAATVDAATYRVGARSVVVLVSASSPRSAARARPRRAASAP